MIGLAALLAAGAVLLVFLAVQRVLEARRGGRDSASQPGGERLQGAASPAEQAKRARLIMTVLSAAVGGLLLFSLIYTLSGRLLLSLLSSIGALMVPAWVSEFQRTRQIIKVSEQLDQAMGLLASALRRGVPLEVAFAQAAEAIGSPLRSVLEQVVAATGVGLGFEQAVSGTRKHPAVAENPDYQVFVTQVAIAQSRGANILETFEALREAISARRRYRAAVQEQMGQHLIQSLMIFGVGFVVLVAYALMTPDGLGPLLRSIVGQFILLASVMGNMFLLRVNHIAMLRQLRRV